MFKGTNLLVLIIISAVQCGSDVKTLDKEQLHEISKRGLGWPWLIYSLNAATGK